MRQERNSGLEERIPENQERASAKENAAMIVSMKLALRLIESRGS